MREQAGNCRGARWWLRRLARGIFDYFDGRVGERFDCPCACLSTMHILSAACLGDRTVRKLLDRDGLFANLPLTNPSRRLLAPEGPGWAALGSPSSQCKACCVARRLLVAEEAGEAEVGDPLQRRLVELVPELHEEDLSRHCACI